MNPGTNGADDRAARRTQAIELAGQGRLEEAGHLFDALLVEAPDDVGHGIPADGAAREGLADHLL